MRHIPEHRLRTLRRALNVLAQAELDGRTMTSRDMAGDLGMSEASGPLLRQDLIRLGWASASQGVPVRTMLTDAGWAELGGRPARTPKVKNRACICCRTSFLSDGPGQRFCPSCRDTDAYRSGAADMDYRVVRP